MIIAMTNPHTNYAVTTSAENTPAMIEKSFKNATEQFPRWRLTRYQERVDVLQKEAAIMRKRQGDLAKLMTTEMGKLVAVTPRLVHDGHG